MAGEEARSGLGASRLAKVLAGASLALLLFWNLGGAPLLEPDEGRYAEIPREMLATGDFVTPHLNGVLYFEKPPLHYWLTAASIRVFGLSEASVRLWSALFGLAGVLVAWRMGRTMGGRRAAFVAALALGSSPLWVAIGRLATLDMTVTFFLTATLACFWLAHEATDRRRALVAWHGAFAAAALAVLAKGLIGIVIPGAVVFLYLLVTGGWRVLKAVPWVTGVALFLAIAAPWHALAASRTPDFLWFYFVHEHVLRYATPEAARHEPFWYFLAVLALGCAPWSGLFPSAARLLPWRRWREGLAERRAETFLAIWAVFVVVFFSTSQSKLIPYVLPALPPLAILVGLLVDRLWGGEVGASRWERAGLAAGGVFAALYGAALVAAGLGKIARAGLEGVVSPNLLGPGVVVLAVALTAAGFALGGSWRGRVLALFAAGCCVAAAIQAVAPLVARERSSKEVAGALEELLRPDDLVFGYRDYPQSAPVYLRRTIGVAAFEGELEFGIGHLAPAARQERFPTAAEFKAVWDSPRRVYVLAGRSWARRFAADGITHARVIRAGAGWTLLANRGS